MGEAIYFLPPSPAVVGGDGVSQPSLYCIDVWVGVVGGPQLISFPNEAFGLIREVDEMVADEAGCNVMFGCCLEDMAEAGFSGGA